MKILQVTRQFHPATGGIEKVVLDLSKKLLQKGHKSDVLTLNRLWGETEILPSKEVVGGVSVIRIPFVGPRQYAFAPEVINFVQNYDLIHLHSSDFFLDFLALFKPFYKPPIVLNTHGLYFHTPFVSRIKKIYLNTVTRMALSQISQLICDSQHDVDLVRGVVPSKKVHLIPNGINLPDYPEQISQREPGLIVSISRLAENKRIHLLLQQLPFIKKAVPFARLVIIGKDWGELQSLKQLCTKLNLDDSVEFMGEVENNVVQDILLKASVFVSASNYESFGISVVEAMAAGCVPVVQDIDAFRDFIIDGQDGFLTDFMDLQAADVVSRALLLPANTRKSIEERAKTKALEYDWETVSSKIELVYFQAIKNR